jgi:hypothetical protein
MDLKEQRETSHALIHALNQEIEILLRVGHH